MDKCVVAHKKTTRRTSPSIRMDSTKGTGAKTWCDAAHLFHPSVPQPTIVM